MTGGWWLVILGLSFVAVTLFAPKGIGGLFDRFLRISTPDCKGAALGPDDGSLQEPEARLLLIDEPAAGMTPAEREQTTALLVSLVEQYFEFAYGLADRIYVFRRGAVSAFGATGDIDKATLRQAVSV